jgi:hypothetical protein
MKLIAYIAIGLVLGYALSIFLDPEFPSIFEILERF